MPPRKRAAAPTDGPEAGGPQRDPAVDAFLAALDHPRKADIVAVRELILATDPRVREAIKWNAPSFRTTEFFATFHLRSKDDVRLVFHTGAKARDLPGGAVRIEDPDGLVEWLGKDRCMVTIPAADLDSRRASVQAIVRAWIDQT